MKTAEEWKENGPMHLTVTVIREIQLDAWRQGMTDAAAVAGEYGGKGHDTGQGWSMQCGDSKLTQSDIQAAILTARDAKSTVPK